MKQLIVLALFLAVAVAQLSCSSSFITDDGYTYNFYEGWFNVTDQNGVDWYFSVCATNAESPCGLDNGEITSVCQVVKEIPIPKGHADTVAVTQSPDGSSRGLELLYGLESAVPVKTVIELVCSSIEDDTKIKVVDNAMSVITFSSPKNCPVTVAVYDDFPQIDEQSNQEVVIHSGAFIYFLFLCVSLVSVCCCCTCLLRRKRIQQRRDIQMKQFSSVAFQPIPHNVAAKTSAPAQQQAPSFNPYIAQPQFVYYYPSQNGSSEIPFPQYTQNADVTQNDENIARNLQAQFDQESV